VTHNDLVTQMEEEINGVHGSILADESVVFRHPYWSLRNPHRDCRD